MFKHIYSFDNKIMEDELVRIMSKSPHTQQYISVRVIEIIEQIMKQPIILALKAELKQVQQKMEYYEQLVNEKQKNQKLKEDKFGSQLRDIKMQKEELEKKVDNFKVLQRKINEYDRQMTINRELQEQNEQLQKYNADLSDEKTRLISERDKIAIKLEQIQQKNIKLNQRNRILLEQLQKVKHNSQSLKSYLNQNKSISQKMNKRVQQLSDKQNKMKEQIRQLQSKRQNQRKQLHKKLLNYQTKTKSYKKIISNIKQKIIPQFHSMSQYFTKQREIMKKQIRSIKQQVSGDYIAILDEIGAKIMDQLQWLMNRVERSSNEVRIYKKQNKIKQETINKLQNFIGENRLLTNQLKKQLRDKKKETNALRKQLQKNYEQKQYKLASLQKNYHQILLGSQISQ